ncbi:hypothetical protein FQN55_000029 [Onygenales sp. PD_40]|nr:hypothetical protein FQN55_000029 [Onygenales sp. PD_40]
MSHFRNHVYSPDAPKPLPQYSQAVNYNGMIYCSGNIGMDPKTMTLVEGSIKDRTQQALTNLRNILEAGGSSFDRAVKCNIFLTTMDNFAAMNDVWDEFFPDDPKSVRRPYVQ